MERLKLFNAPPRQAVETEFPQDLHRGCNRCPMHRRPGLHTPCMPADGEGGGLLVVSDYPGESEDRSGRPLIGPSGQVLRALVSELWKGPVVYDNAVKCSPGAINVYHEDAPDQCRTYLAAILRDAQPKRILALGARAMEGLLGRKLPPFSVRRGYAYLSTGVPILFSFNTVGALRNRHLRRFVREDLTWALKDQPMFGPAWGATAEVVVTLDDALEAERRLRASPWFSYDVETAGEAHDALQILAAALYPQGSQEGFVWSPEAMGSPGPREVLGRLVGDARLGKTGNNLKYDFTASTLDLGVRAVGLHGDNRLMRKLVDADADGDLETMGELVGMGGHKEEMRESLDLAIKRVQKTFKARHSTQLSLLDASSERGFMREDVWNKMLEYPHIDEPKAFAYGLVPRETLMRYVCRDSLTSRMLQEWSEAQMANDSPAITRTWRTIVKPAAEAVRQVEEWGIAVDRHAIENFQRYLQQRKAELLVKMQQWGSFDPSNPHEVGRLLFDQLKLPGGTRTAKSGQWATDAETLERVAASTRHLLPNLIVESKTYDKMMSNYALGMQRYIRADGRIHPHLLLDGTRSGRLSCQSPNLQNIPRDGDSAEGKMARDCFVASKDHLLVSLDYSQLELRIAAALSGDEEMLKIFHEGGDFHQRTAEFIAPIVWRIDPKSLPDASTPAGAKAWKKYRSAAKAFNFGILYGMSDEGIAARAGCSVQEAARIREAVLGKFAKLAAWIQKVLRYAKQHGICWTWWDGQNARRRPLWEIDDPDGLRRATAEHSSWNTPIQGTGSDFCLMSLTGVVNWIHEDAVPAKLVLPVHDSLLLDTHQDAVEEVIHQAHRIMTSWNANGVPISVDVETGHSWGSLQRYDTSRLAA